MDSSAAAGDFWGGQAISPIFFTGNSGADASTAGRFNVALGVAGEFSTGSGTVLSFDVCAPASGMPGDLWNIDFLTGANTLTTYRDADGTSTFADVTSVSGTVSIVPEPSAILMGLISFAGLLAVVRRK